MWKDSFNKFIMSLAKKPEQPSGAETPQVPMASAKKRLEAEKSERDKQDKIAFAILCVVVIGGYFFLTSGEGELPEGYESVIPLSQLTGQIGAQPRNETLEQQFRRENKNIPLSDGSKIPKEIIAEKTRLFQQVPFGDKELTYEMRLPTSWGQSKFAQYGTPPGAEKYDVLTNIDRYFGPSVEDQRPFVWLEVERLNRRMNAAYYMDLYFIKRGITPESVKIYDEKKAEALFVDVRDYNTYAVRTLFVVNGDRIVVVTFGVPLMDYQNYKDVMGLTLHSFRFLNDIDRQPEPAKNYKLLNVLSFDYLPRWKLRNENRTSSLNPSVEFILPTELNIKSEDMVDGQQIEGLIVVNAWRNRPGFNKAVIEQTIIKRLAVGGMKLKDVLQPEKALPAYNDIANITQAIYVGLIDQSPPTTEEFGVIQNDSAFPRQEVWVTVLDNGDYTAAVTLVTWPQIKNYKQWATNVIAYQTILRSLKLRKLVF